MNSRTRLGLLAVVGGLTIGTASADWTQWRGSNRDGVAGSFEAPASWPDSLTKQWEWASGNSDATPIVAGDRVYVHSRIGDEELITCLNAADGGQIWQQRNPGPSVEGGAREHFGPRSTPVFAEGKLFTLGVGGLVTCLNAEDGEILWTNHDNPKTPRFYTAMSPVVMGDKVIYQLGGAERPPRGEEAGPDQSSAIVAFYIADGLEAWRVAGGKSTTHASPTVVTVAGMQQVAAEYQGGLIGLDPADGSILWDIPLEPTGRGRSRYAASPVSVGDTVYTCGFNGGTQAYRIDMDGDGYRTAQIWHNAEVDAMWATPVFKDGLLFGLNDSGFLYCLDAATGETKWVDETNRDDSYGALIDLGPSIALQPNKSKLVIFEPTGESFKLVKEYDVADQQVFSSPAFTGNRIFIQDHDSIVMYTL